MTDTATSPFIPSDQPITWERVDQGQDLRSTPGGQVVAPWAGTVSLAPSNPGGFGTHYALYTPTEGPHKGVTFYIGHAWALVAGKVKAGGAIARLGTGSESWMGNAKGIPGHVEIGLWPPGSMSAGSQVVGIVKGDSTAATSSSTDASTSGGSAGFLSDPVGSIVRGIVGPIEQNALRMLLYAVLIFGAVALIVTGSLTATHEGVQ